ncbi:tail fiber domain-containing protein [Plastoroseomonas hellenica]|uniref:tail fiber domain-containing protein n=1 Tax=Plastoroseomonas hellenica TaxID=2687306 RepID=UPI001BA8B15A|nr:tail fiber domain-containing protein [Plastoroseomonas hellenica]MBR0647710.1 tail fiber domain-containing protein [Plastoroseomonas hellenica]
MQQVHVPAVSAYIHMIFSGWEWRWDNAGNFYTPSNGLKPGGGSWADSSDARVKERIEAYPTGLNAILQLSPKIYSFKAETGRDPARRFIGAIAQDVEGVMPEMVTSGRLILGEFDLADGRMMEQTSLPWALVNAVKELHAIVEAQAARIAALETAQA